MIPQQIEIRLDTFDIVARNDSGPDEPYLWTFFVKLDGTVIDLFSPQRTQLKVHGPAGSHGDLNLPGGEMTAADVPRAIPPAIGRWRTTLEQGNLLNAVIPQLAVAALVIGWEEDLFPSTAAMEEARETLRANLQAQLTAVVRDVVATCLADPANCSANVDFESEISVDRLRAVVLDVLSAKLMNFVTAAILVNPLFALAGDADELIGYGIAGPFFLPELLSAPDHRIDFTLDLAHAEQNTPGAYRVKGHVTVLEPQLQPQVAVVEDDMAVKVIGRDPVIDAYFMARMAGGETGPYRRIGEGKFKSGPAAALSGDGLHLQVFGLGLDDRFWRAMSDNGGKDWRIAWQKVAPDIFSSPPAVAMSGNGQRLMLVGRDAARRLRLARSGDGGAHWSSFEPIGQGLFLGGAGVCCAADGQQLYAFGTGLDHRVWWARSGNGGQSWQMAWSPLGEQKVQSAPAAVCSDDGRRIRVFACDMHRRLWQTGSDDGGVHWLAWTPLPKGRIVSTPAASMSRDGQRIHLVGLAGNLLMVRNGSSDGGAHWHDKYQRIDDVTPLY